jgi:hypothetical protein
MDVCLWQAVQVLWTVTQFHSVFIIIFTMDCTSKNFINFIQSSL